MIVTVFYATTLNQSSDSIQNMVEHAAISACCVMGSELNAAIEVAGNRIMGKTEEEAFDYVNDRLYELEESVVTRMGYVRQAYWFKEDDFIFKAGIKDIAVIIDPMFPLAQQPQMDAYMDKVIEYATSNKSAVELVNGIDFNDPMQSVPFMFLLLTTSQVEGLTFNDTSIVQYSNSVVGNSLVLGLPDSEYLNVGGKEYAVERQELMDDVLNREA